jgi:hypothetical protein
VENYIPLTDTLKYISMNILYVVLRINILMMEKVHEASRKAAETTLMLFYAKVNNNEIWIDSWPTM